MCFVQVITIKYGFYVKTNTCCGSVQNKHQHMVLYALSSPNQKQREMRETATYLIDEEET
jgi:hypothetical protein